MCMSNYTLYPPDNDIQQVAYKVLIKIRKGYMTPFIWTKTQNNCIGAQGEIAVGKNKLEQGMLHCIPSLDDAIKYLGRCDWMDRSYPKRVELWRVLGTGVVAVGKIDPFSFSPGTPAVGYKHIELMNRVACVCLGPGGRHIVRD